MAYFGCQFVFDDIPSWEYGLVIYDFGEIEEDGGFSSMPKIVEDRIARRYTPLHYGVTRNEPLKFKLHFGVDPRAIDRNQWLDRWEIDAIASWLTEHDDYKYLEIFQQDLDAIRYKCIITDLTYSSYGKYPWAFTCEVTCDGPYAYLTPETISRTFAATTNSAQISMSFPLMNLASPRVYRPAIRISNLSNLEGVGVYCDGDEDNAFEINDLTGVGDYIDADNEREILSCESGLNLYDRFNLRFFRLLRGKDTVWIKVWPKTLNQRFTVTVDFQCEFPINTGG